MSATTSLSPWPPSASAAAVAQFRRSSSRYLAELQAALKSGGTDGEATILALALALDRWWREPDADVLWRLVAAAHQPSGKAGRPDTAELDLRRAAAAHDRAERRVFKAAAAALGMDTQQPPVIEALRIVLYGTARSAMLDGPERAASVLPAVVSGIRRLVVGSNGSALGVG
jgi:hypothetical protein